MILVDSETWVKAGIEFVDGVPRLSCVVTNSGYSDWSTQHWAQWDPKSEATSIRIRVTKLLPGKEQGPSLVMEAAALTGDPASTEGANWFQVRIASLRSGDAPWRMGLFSISPIAQQGSCVRFYHLKIGAKQDLMHDMDAEA